MTKSLKEFKDSYLELLIGLLWRQWSSLGVAGYTDTGDSWIIDPEALFLFTCSIGRYDARLFDEALDWISANGNFMNIQRLRNILKKEEFSGSRVLSAISGIMEKRTRSYKWKILSGFSQNKTIDNEEPLFFYKDGKHIESYGEQDDDFKAYGFIRGQKEFSRKTQSVNMAKNSGLLFKLRTLFGVNARSEIILYLLTHGRAHPSLVAREMYYSQKAVQDTLVEMAKSGLVLVSSVGKEKQYILPRDKWFEFLECHDEQPKWLNWALILRTLEKIWMKLNDNKILGYDPLLQSSELRVLMQEVRPKIENAGFSEVLTDDRLHPGENYSVIFFRDVKRLLEAISNN